MALSPWYEAVWYPLFGCCGGTNKHPDLQPLLYIDLAVLELVV